MISRGILFKTDLVRKLPVKTQTRRLPLRQPPSGAHTPRQQPDPSWWLWTLRSHGGYQMKHRYGVPGDRFWVRETWCFGPDETLIFKADAISDEHKWNSPLHLRKADARHWLSVIDVHPEQLRQLDDTGARAEGFANREDFFAAWDWINGGGIGSPHTSAANPWVWVITFRLLSAEESPAPHEP